MANRQTPALFYAAGYEIHVDGVTTSELRDFEKRVHSKIRKERNAGKLRHFRGDIEALIVGKRHR